MYIKPNQEVEEAGCGKRILTTKLIIIATKKKIKEENVLSTETKRVNNSDVSDYNENYNDDNEKKFDYKYHKKQAVRLNEINQEANDIKFVEIKLKGVSKSGKFCKILRQMMHQV